MLTMTVTHLPAEGMQLLGDPEIPQKLSRLTSGLV